GDYGLVGAMLHRFDEKTNRLAVELFLLSCRAMGKGGEWAMHIALGEQAGRSAAESVAVAHRETDRNEPCRRFFDSVGGFTLPSYEAAELPPLPSEPEAKSVREKTVGDPPPAIPIFDAALARRIATELSDPHQVHARTSEEKRPRPELSQ